MSNKYFMAKMTANHMIVLLCLGLMACDLENVAKDAPIDYSTTTSLTKTVAVHEFTQVKGQPFNFGATTVPDLIAISDGILYTVLSSTNDLYSWQISKGNIASAWVKLDDFEGSDTVANFDLNSGTRTIEKLLAMKNGVAAGLSDDTSAMNGTDEGALGVAFFSGQQRKAQRSFSLFESRYNFKSIELSFANGPNNERVFYSLEHRAAGGPFTFVVWVNLDDFSTSEAQGLPNTRVLKFPGPPETDLPSNSPIAAIAPLPDGRVALAKSDGLLTIAKDSVGKKNSDNPMLEQKTDADVLSPGHAAEWQTSAGIAPTEIGAMRLVGKKYLVIGFVDDGTDNGGMKFADATQPNFKFSTNLDVPTAKIKSIAVDGDEAYLVDEDAIYRFHDKKFSKVIANDALQSNLAYVQPGVRAKPSDPEPPELNEKTFKGGNTGDVPVDGAKFHNVAVSIGSLFITTDKGIFRVEPKNVTRTFNVPKPKKAKTN